MWWLCHSGLWLDSETESSSSLLQVGVSRQEPE
jgi:hypothetical protein